MRPRESAEPRFTTPALPPGTRIYAVGDIHGRSDLLTELIQRIDEDRLRRPIAHAFEIYLGDYIDRGPHSSAVVETLAWRIVRTGAICLRGNHEALLEAALDDASYLRPWLSVGGNDTLESYGLPGDDDAISDVELHLRLNIVFPEAHRLFLRCLRNMFSCGDFLFVHAGIRPGIPPREQSTQDLLWIRDDFLLSKQNHGPIVVHGHTPVMHPEFLFNRINIDTGAWFSGVLTCIAIEGTDVIVL
ncbi:MAG: serine/threonine protein phosphatase [Xanthobacteraceae bacterium]|nr:serine/threonine protein phosphatase [Xanthobacteraceae bacterium]